MPKFNIQFDIKCSRGGEIELTDEEYRDYLRVDKLKKHTYGRNQALGKFLYKHMNKCRDGGYPRPDINSIILRHNWLEEADYGLRFKEITNDNTSSSLRWIDFE